MGAVITVARQLGSEGSVIATEVARRLSFRYFDREILHRAAEIVGFPDEQMLAKLESKEHRHSIQQRILEAMPYVPPSVPSATMREYGIGGAYVVAPMTIENYDAVAKQYEAEQAERVRTHAAKGYRALVEQAIVEQAEMGDAIIVGRGGQVILHDFPGVLNVLVMASESVRVDRLIERMGFGEKDARRRVRVSDSEREAYLKQFENSNWLDSTLYDLVINTGRVPTALAVDLICEAVQNL